MIYTHTLNALGQRLQSGRPTAGARRQLLSPAEGSPLDLSGIDCKRRQPNAAVRTSI
jgi:hypothetical protein